MAYRSALVGSHGQALCLAARVICSQKLHTHDRNRCDLMRIVEMSYRENPGAED